MVAISCYVVGIQCTIPAHRFGNAVKQVGATGMPMEATGKTPSSNKLTDVEQPPLQGHDALDHAFSMAYAVQHLLRTGKLRPEVLGRT